MVARGGHGTGARVAGAGGHGARAVGAARTLPGAGRLGAAGAAPDAARGRDGGLVRDRAWRAAAGAQGAFRCSSSRICLLRILPAALRGSAATKRTSLGSLKPASS